MPDSEPINEELTEEHLLAYRDMAMLGIHELLNLYDLTLRGLDINGETNTALLAELETMIEDPDPVLRPVRYWRCHHCDIWNSIENVGLDADTPLVCSCGRNQHWLPGDDE